MSAKAIISLIAALAIAVSGIGAPAGVFAAQEVSDKELSGDKVPAKTGSPSAASGDTALKPGSTIPDEVKISGYYAFLAALSMLDRAASILREPAIAAAAAGAAKAAETAAALSGLEIPETAPDEDEESLWYCPDIPMKKEHQKLLWECCKERGLDYIDMLALIALESNFQEKCSNGKYKGYFQLSADHGPSLSKQLNTKNDPLDGAINIIWGTAFYSWILVDARVKDLEGKEKRDVALSIYQRGPGGYDRYGKNEKYLEKYYQKRDMIVKLFENR